MVSVDAICRDPLICAGWITGFCSGLLGIGSGLIIAPAMMLGLPLGVFGAKLTSKDPARLKRFNTAGWLDVAECTVADTLAAFLHELYAIHEAHSREASAQQDALVSDRGRGR